MGARLIRQGCVLTAAVVVLLAAAVARVAAAPLPVLTEPVTDLAGVIDSESAARIDELSRTLQQATGDVVVVVTTPSIEPFAGIGEYAVELFENHGRGIGERGEDNGVLIVLSMRERAVWIEVGYGLEPWITDGFAGETIDTVMIPELRNGRYGAGLLAGTARLATRIAEARNVMLTGVDLEPVPDRPEPFPVPLAVVLLVFAAIVLLGSRLGGPGRTVRRWGRDGWSGWSSGVGPFGSSGGGGGGGFGGGFGGFGGGRSGGGGAGGRW